MRSVIKAWALAVACFALVAVVSCNEPTEVSVFAPVDTLFHFDTLVVHDTTIEFVHDTTIVTDTLYITDTLIVFVHDTTTVFDTLRVYCWLLKSQDRTPQFECDDGYRGPRI